VLLPSDTHRKPITSITAILLPFVTYLLAICCTFLLGDSGVQWWFVCPQSCILVVPVLS
jgi:hypothetical protein